MSYLFPSSNLVFQQVAEIQLKIGQFAGKYQILMIISRQIYRYVLTKLHLMSVPVFRCVSARHYRFEGKEKMGTHLIIKIRRIYISRNV